MSRSAKKPAASKNSVIKDVLLMATPSKNADLRWFSGFHASDPFPAFSAKGRKIGLLPLLEVGRAKQESDFDEVLNLTEIINDLRKTNPQAGVADAIVFAAVQRGVHQFRVPGDFPAGLYLRLEELGLKLVPAGSLRDERSGPALFPERWVKSKSEIEGIKAGNRAACAGFSAVEKILAEAKADKKGKLHWKGETLTAEILQDEVQAAVIRAGGLCDTGLICAPGDQAVDCHCAGSGPIYQGQLLVLDIFPRDRASWNYGDMTRTYLKGKATPEQRKMVLAVKEAHQRIIKALKAGVTGAEIHQIPVEYFKSLGYQTGLVKGTYVGFFHGTGHGLGFDIHEEPYLSHRNPGPLKVGNAITVEPGLYYPGIGGCRFEDCVLITAKGCTLLSHHPYRWEIA
jgi:Xaa-Pro aminopeptidase